MSRTHKDVGARYKCKCEQCQQENQISSIRKKPIIEYGFEAEVEDERSADELANEVNFVFFGEYMYYDECDYNILNYPESLDYIKNHEKKQQKPLTNPLFHE